MEYLYQLACRYYLDLLDISYDILTYDNIIVDVKSKSGLIHSFIFNWIEKDINDLISYLNNVNVNYSIRKEEL